MVLVYTPANQFFTDLMKNVSQTLHLGTPKATNSPAEMEEFLINNNTPYIAGVQFNINTVMLMENYKHKMNLNNVCFWFCFF